MTAAPTLTTARLTLRGQSLDDFEDCAAMWGDPAVTAHIGGRPLSREAAWTKFLRNRGHWPLFGFGYWVVRESASGRFAGEVGCAELRRNIHPPREGTPEAGWVLPAWAHGRGFATEAVSAALAWMDDRGWRQTYCLIDPANAASIRVAQKCGFVRTTDTVYDGTSSLVLTRG